MTRFEGSLARLAAIPDERLDVPSPWPGAKADADAEADVRYVVLFRALEREQEAAVRARLAYRGGEAARALGLAQVAFGDLRGLLVGLTEEEIDRVPAQGQWSVRRTMVHVIEVERSYRAGVEYAVGRGPDEPALMPAARRPPADPADTGGDGTAIALRLGVRRSETDAALGRIRDEQLTAPTRWSGFWVDARFRLHRFASHLVEHTIQCETALERTGYRAGDARRTVRRISIARAMHERIGPAAVLAELDRALETSLAQLTAA